MPGRAIRTFPTASLLEWYGRHGRSLPWRATRDPYAVAVSEFMLAQTQVARVLPAYAAFMQRFPDVNALAAASAADVIRAWKGLGYNSRAVRLRQLAVAVVQDHGGRFPADSAGLRALPGVGPYTAAAIRAFAFEETDLALDTNLRRVLQRVLSGLEAPQGPLDVELEERSHAAIFEGRSHDFNSALMDLGASLCTARAPKCLVCPLRDACAAAPVDAASLASALAARSARKAPQERLPFEATNRFVRGRIVDCLRALPPHQAISMLDLNHSLSALLPPERLRSVGANVARLIRDGLIEKTSSGVRLTE